MIERTFQHIRKIGPKTERRLWDMGLTTWDRFQERHGQAGLGRGLIEQVLRELPRSRRAVETGDAAYFSQRLPGAERWRLFGTFGTQAVYLDIETTGLDRGLDHTTVVGLYDGSRSHLFVRGINLDSLPETLARYKVVVTFNGGCFDLPFLKREFPELPMPGAHIDLRTVLYGLGYKGGLKRIEKQLGVARSDDTDGVDGFEAVLLWHRFRQRGDRAALRKLLYYNLEDVVNLKALMEFAFKSHAGRNAGAAGPLEPADDAVSLEMTRCVEALLDKV